MSQPFGNALNSHHTGESKTFAVVGDLYKFLATGEDTDGKYALWEASVFPGGGPPPHIHSREVEAFYVLEGEVAFSVEGNPINAIRGAFVHVPIGTLHTFKNEGQSLAKMLIMVAPAGLERMFQEVGQLVSNASITPPPVTQAEIERLLSIAPRYGIEIRM